MALAQITGTALGETLTGSDGYDIIDGHGGGDVILALGGDDFISIGDGTDLVEAGDGRDSVSSSGGGDDVIHLGAGDDSAYVDNANDSDPRTVTLWGQAGNDYFLLNDQHLGTAFNIDGGVGSDEIRLQSFGHAVVQAGEGDDTVFLFDGGDATLTLGQGQDAVFFEAQTWRGDSVTTILDFQVSGPSADRLDITDLLRSGPAGGSIYSVNPFAAGHVRLVQSSADTLVQVLAQGDYATAIRLVDVVASTLTAFSFNGWDPHGVSLGSGVEVTGGSDPDRIFGSRAADHLLGGDGGDYIEGLDGFDLIEGQGGDDQLVGRGVDGQTLLGGDGDDYLKFYYSRFSHAVAEHAVLMDGGAGKDYIYFDATYGVVGKTVDVTLKGGDGDDHLNSFGVVDSVTMLGGDGDDTLSPGGARGYFDGGAGVDTLWLDSGDGVTVDLGAGVMQSPAASATVAGFENITGSSGADSMAGDAGANALNGDVGDDVLHGAGGADLLWGGDGDDALYGDGGIDLLIGGAGADLYDGGTGGEGSLLVAGGGDVVDFRAATTAVVIDLSNTGPQDTGFGLDRFAHIEEIWGGQAEDTLTGDDLANRLLGYEGSDHLNGGGGGDVLIGGRGNDVIDGGAGFDTVILDDAAGGATVDLGAGTVREGDYPNPSHGLGSDTLISIEGVSGSGYADTLIGASGDNVLLGQGGDDLLRGLAGDDLLDGGAGDDTADFSDATGAVTVDLNITAAQDTGVGRDTLTGIENVIAAGGDDLLTGDANVNVLDGGGGQDWLISNGGADALKGGDGHDSLWGGTGDDVLEGGGGSDTLFGGDGRDTVSYASATSAVRVDLTQLEDQNTGGGGFDTLVSIENVTGSDYADVLIGDARDNVMTGGKTTWVGGGLDPTRFQGDVMTGGGGNDTFVFSNKADADGLMVDRITDFSAGDRIDFSGIDLDIWASGRQGLHFGSTPDHVGDITVFHYDTVTAVSVVTDTSSTLGMTIYLTGWVDLTANDFIL